MSEHESLAEQADSPRRGIALIRDGLLARNVVLNLAGSIAPALVAVAAVPILVRSLGDARFGILALAWTALGYFSLFDLGIARSVTHAVADRLGDDRHHEIGAIIRTSIAALVPIGVLAGALLFLAAPFISTMLSLAPAMHAESTTAFRVLGVAVPFASASAALRGALEGTQRFGLVNALRIPLGILTFLGPVLTLPFSRSVVPAIVVLTVGRALLFFAHLAVVLRAIPEVRAERQLWNGSIARRLIAVGGWMQVSHIVSPLMATLDRFVVGAVMGVGMVTYYVAPLELVTKMWLFPIGVLPVFFSAASLTSTRDALRTTVLFDKLLRVTLIVLFLPTLILVALGADILKIWLGPAFAAQSSVVMQVIAVAVFVNCLGQGALSLVQALGRPDLSAKYHLAELPVYALLLWWLLPRYGIVGAALAWSIRTVGDTVILLITCPVLLSRTRETVGRMALWLIGCCGVLGIAAIASGTMLRFAIVAAALPVWIFVAWRYLLTAEERVVPSRMFNAVLRPERA